jgi:hypothetical protein
MIPVLCNYLTTPSKPLLLRHSNVHAALPPISTPLCPRRRQPTTCICPLPPPESVFLYIPHSFYLMNTTLLYLLTRLVYLYLLHLLTFAVPLPASVTDCVSVWLSPLSLSGVLSVSVSVSVSSTNVGYNSVSFPFLPLTALPSQFPSSPWKLSPGL